MRTAVGDRYVVEAMRAGGYNFGGEQSGHLVFLDHATTGDGIVAALQVLAIMIADGQARSPSSPRRRWSACRRSSRTSTLAARKPLEEMRAARRAIGARSRRRSATTGRVLVRWSGTEPKLRIMVEGEDPARIAAYAKELAAAAKKDAAPRGVNGKAQRARGGAKASAALTSR